MTSRDEIAGRQSQIFNPRDEHDADRPSQQQGLRGAQTQDKLRHK